MIYKYTATNSRGQSIKGQVNAKDKLEAISKLQQALYQDISIFENYNIKNVKNILENTSFSFFNGVSLKDLVNMSRQMSALLEAGVSVLKAFQLLADESPKGNFKNILSDVVLNVKSGSSISQALAKHPDVFDNFYVSMVKSGEESGKLAYTFTYMSEYLDRAYTLTSKVKNAMIYPAFVIGTFLIVMILMFTTVIPKLALVLTESGVPLPWITEIVLGISNFLVNYGIYAFFMIAAVIFYLYVSLRHTDSFKNFFDTVKIKVPVVRNVFKMLYVTRIADNIETLLTSGVSLTKSIQISSEVVGNVHYRNILDKALLDVKAGTPFSKSLGQHTALLPGAMIQMVRIGEETGEMGKLMGNVAKFYQREINAAVDTMVGLIEPIMIVLLAVGVGLLLVSVLLPIYNLAGAF